MKTLKLGIPKGSLQDKTVEIFKKAGFDIYISSRSYTPGVDDPEISLVLIRAQEMSRYVADGALDCGITGEDWILENDSDVVRVAELLYSKVTANPVRWVVAVKNESPIKKIEDLQGKRIATELVGFTKRFFKKNKIDVDVEFSWGATEVKVGAGLVDAIVDLTETGSSLKANNLREIATLCTSTTKFIANKTSHKDDWKRRKMEHVVMLLRGALEAVGKVGLKMNLKKENLDAIISVLPALKKPTI
jgi:ATP phosphoribosyltransferase